MKLKDLMHHIELMTARHPDIMEFDIVAPEQGTGALSIREMGPSIALPEERLLAFGCNGFVLRGDIK